MISYLAWTSVDYSNDTIMQQLGIRAQYGDGLAVSVESMGQISFQKLYRSVESEYSNTTVTFPVLMAIINVVDGKVKVRIKHRALIKNINNIDLILRRIFDGMTTASGVVQIDVLIILLIILGTECRTLEIHVSFQTVNVSMDTIPQPERLFR